MRRLTILASAPTAAAREGRFPEADEPIEAEAAARLPGLRGRWPATRTMVAPERRAAQTMTALALAGEVDAALADLGMGDWQGRRLDEIDADDPAQSSTWLHDPRVSPPAGESVGALVARVGAWLDRQSGSDVAPAQLAVTHPSVARAAVLVVLRAPLEAFWSVDAPALSTTTLTSNGTRWALRSHGVRLGEP